MCYSNYKKFVKGAFEIAGYKEVMKREGKDPAGIINIAEECPTDDYKCFNKIKIGLAYAIAIYNDQYCKNRIIPDSEDDDKMTEFMEKSLRVSNIWEIETLIEKYTAFKNQLFSQNDKVHIETGA